MSSAGNNPATARARRRLHVLLGLAGMLAALSATLLGASSVSARALPAGPVDPQISDGTAQAELDAAVAHWNQAGIADYHFTVERICFCVPAFRGPATIIVRGGEALAPPAQFEDVATVAKLHALVQKAIDDQVEDLEVHYDDRGVPVSIQVDASTMIADEEVSFRVTDFAFDAPAPWARGDLALLVHWRGPNDNASRKVICRDGVLVGGWPDRAVCARLLTSPTLTQPITVETRDLRITPDTQLFIAVGHIEGRWVAFSWLGRGSSTRLARLRAWETALGEDAIATVRGS
jgi:hypothetical protein